jgi:hypothetical protein
MNSTINRTFVFVCLSLVGYTTLADEIQFDLPPTAEAIPVLTESDGLTDLVSIQLRLSSMIESAEVPRIDQWLVRCEPRDSELSVFDYAPRTETASDLATPIQIKKIEERTNSIGVALDGSYGPIAHGNVGVDQSNKNIDSIQFERIAPVQAVSAAGTINRGHGVYFKLRWTAQQVLEGEKTFSITLRVPRLWRGGLMDVSVTAQAKRKSLGWDNEPKTLGAANFVVGIYRQGDGAAANLVQSLADAEQQLRQIARQHAGRNEPKSLPSMLRQVAVKLDLESTSPNTDWMWRLLADHADPHIDKEISKLPMPIRIAVLDYVDVRDELALINHSQSSDPQDERVLVAKPAQ